MSSAVEVDPAPSQNVGHRRGAQAPARAPRVAPPGPIEYLLRDFRAGFPRVAQLERSDPELVETCERLASQAREYADLHVRPYVEDWDRRAAEEPGFVPWKAIKAGLPYRFLSLAAPRAVGGLGCRTPAMAIFVEELCTADAGIANIFGAHALGMLPVLASLKVDWYTRFLGDVVAQEQRGIPALFAAAHTEPEAGSDVEDAEDVRRARVMTRARRVDGGYRISGRKVFISNGSISRYIWLSAFEDLRRPHDSAITCVIRNDAPGFLVSRVEHKLGQRLCPAAELTLEDVFVPDEDCYRPGPRMGRMLMDVLSLTRAPVGAIAIGIARGALERVLHFLSERRVNGRWLFEEQWVQLKLMDMLAAIQAGRQLYLDAAIAGETMGLQGFLTPRLQRLSGRMPRAVLDNPYLQRAWRWGPFQRTLQAMEARVVPERQQRHLLGLASMAKFFCSDQAMRVCRDAMEILGEDAMDPKWGVEKCLRDAKLTQIYEGTNQINRLHAARGLFARRGTA